MKKKLYSYKNSGVNISLGNKFVKHISKLTNKNVKKRIQILAHLALYMTLVH